MMIVIGFLVSLLLIVFILTRKYRKLKRRLDYEMTDVRNVGAVES